MKNRGKKLEGELGPALKHLGCWDYNSNDPSPACDRIIHWEGHGILLEAKETRDGKLPWSRFTERELRYLYWHAGIDPEYPDDRTPPHGLTLVVVELVLTSRSRMWVARWEDVVDMFAASRVKHLVFPTLDPRWREVHKVDRPHSLGRTWGLETVLRELLRT